MRVVYIIANLTCKGIAKYAVYPTQKEIQWENVYKGQRHSWMLRTVWRFFESMLNTNNRNVGGHIVGREIGSYEG